MSRNPYSPPAAAVADQLAPLGVDRVIPNGRTRPLHHGWKWIAEGWALFKRQPGMWILSIVLCYAAIVLLSLIPLVNFLVSLVWPIFIAGFFAMADKAYRGERFTISDLFSGFKKNLGTLVLVGGIYLLSLLAVIGVFIVFGGAKWFGIASGTADPAAVIGLGVALVIYFVVIMLISTAIAFAPGLVQLNGLSAVTAMKMSMVGSMKNILPGLLFAILFFFIMVVSMLPLGLGLLITIPMIATTFYSAYRDIFVESKPA